MMPHAHKDAMTKPSTLYVNLKNKTKEEKALEPMG